MTSARNLPETIKLSALDMSFLIPETEDIAGAYFPMSVACVAALKRPLKAEELVAALHQVDQRFPQFRLGYKLDYVHNRWVRVPDDQLESHWAGCVEMRQSNLDMSEKLSKAVRSNITALDKPIMFYLDNRHIVVKMHHTLGDA